MPSVTEKRFYKTALVGLAFVWGGLITNKGIIQPAYKRYVHSEHVREKKEAKLKLAADYETSPLKSEAVFILPLPGEADGDGAKARLYTIRDELIRHGVPAYMVGDTAGATTAQIQQNIRKIQETYHYNAVTVLSLTHGSLYDIKAQVSYDSCTAIPQVEAWEKARAHTVHLTSTRRDHVAPTTHDLMKDMASAANVKKMDWVSLTCFAGAIDQNNVNVLPKGSTFIGMAGGGQYNYFGAHQRLLESLQKNTFDFDEGVDATDFLVEGLKENWRSYKADIVIGVSGGNAMAVIPSDDHKNTYDYAGAQASSSMQMEKAKKIKIKKYKQPTFH